MVLYILNTNNVLVVDEESRGGNCLFLRARGWGIDCQVRKKLQIPGGVPGGDGNR